MLRDILDKRTIVLAQPQGGASPCSLLMPQLFRDEAGEALVGARGCEHAAGSGRGRGVHRALFCSLRRGAPRRSCPTGSTAYARYGVGSLVNSFASRARGDAVRLALFAKASPGDHKCLTAGKALAGVAVARLACVGVLLLATMKPIALVLLLLAPVLGRVPTWVAAATVARVAAAAAVAAAVGFPRPC